MGEIDNLILNAKAVSSGDCPAEAAALWKTINSKGVLDPDQAMVDPSFCNEGGTLWQWFRKDSALEKSEMEPGLFDLGLQDLMSRGMVRDPGPAHPGLFLAYITKTNK